MPQRATYVASPRAPRTLVRILEAVPGESLQSYIDRLAAKHDVPLGLILSRLDLVTHDKGRPPAGYGILLEEHRLETFSRVSNLPPEIIRQMLMSTYDGVALDMKDADPAKPDTLRGVSVSEWAYFSGSHYCPGCLKETGGAWQLAWKLPWSFCCAKHGVMLNASCPSCGQRAARGRADGWSTPVFHARVPRPGRCHNPLPTGQAAIGKGGAPCGCLLSEAPVIDIASHAATLAAQERVQALLRSGAAPQGKATAKIAFAELRSLSALFLYCAELEDLGEALLDVSRLALEAHIHERRGAQAERKELEDGRTGPRPRSYLGTPKDPALMAALVPLAMKIADLQDGTKLRRHLQPFADRIKGRSPKYRWAALEYFRFSERLREAMTQCLESRGTFDRRSGHLSSKARPYAFQACNVPQLAPLNVYETLFAPLFEGVRTNHARLFCSMALIKLLGATWAEVVEILGLPENMHRFPNSMVTHLNGSNRYDEFTVQLHRWAAQTSEQTRKVNHGAARRALADFRDFDDPDWRSICAAAELGVGKRGGRRKYAAAWLWADLTGGDWQLSPALRTDDDITNQREVYRTLQKTLLPQLAPHLRAFGRRLIKGTGAPTTGGDEEPKQAPKFLSADDADE